MERVITVKGKGNVRVKPDVVVITMKIEAKNHGYDQAMKQVSEDLKSLQDVVENLGFETTELKTIQFNVQTVYESYLDQDKNYKSRFGGYLCEQGLKFEFDFDQAVLSKVLGGIGKTKAKPHLTIAFTVKDKDKVSEELLISATNNARTKAEILAKASGVTLGELINIDYNWSELRLYSQMEYAIEDRCMEMTTSDTPEIEPDDIEVNDTVSFIWKIK